MTTIHTILALAASQSWPLHLMNVKNTFLHSDLKEEVYIKLSYGMHTPFPNTVCKLKYSLYVLKQATIVWFEKFHSTILGFSLMSKTPKDIIVLLVYVDDIVVTSSDQEAISRLHILHSTFHMKKLGHLTYLLGLELNLQIPPLLTLPLKLMSNIDERKVTFLIILLYIVRYILGFSKHGLFFPTNSPLNLQAYSDADWAGCPNIRKSTIGWCMFLGNAFISWKCKKQDSVSKSSTEVEYCAMFAAYSKIIWLCGLLTEFGFP
ncbi:putative mitochondrial protein, partial [Mucuna pruriens]